jgi:pyruvate, water dikinase
MVEEQFSTGLPQLDRVLKGLIPGDNIVWQVNSIDDFKPFVQPYCQYALQHGRQVVYFRFADHEPLAFDDWGVTVHKLETSSGFEQFITGIHRMVGAMERGTFFLFDCLSSLAEDWCSDSMLGNFFKLTCPYILDRESFAYFPLYSNYHSFHATTPIAATTQILIDVYRHDRQFFIHPTKVQHRYSPTMYMLHAWQGNDFVPVTQSAVISAVLAQRPWPGLDSVRLRQGMWNRHFLQAEDIWESLQQGQESSEEAVRCFRTLLRMAISRDERVLQLAEKYFDLDDILKIWKRMIGTGLIGGKAVGMLLARAILRKTDPRWDEVLEHQDSFFIGSDVFYTYLVQNGCWWLRQKQRDPRTFLDDTEEARRRILNGEFPHHIETEFSAILDYFGQSPMIVRSSSLLEDNYGNAFAGKYESVFCPNQGPHHKRLEDFTLAVRAIYASTMSEKALRYRAQRGLLDCDEQMSLLVQRVSGSRYGDLYYPQLAGVGYSFNPFVWNKHIDPHAGVLRLVFGLGTRAVDRSDDDYTRIVALNAPNRRPESDANEVRQYSQKKVDVIDLEANRIVTRNFEEVVQQSPNLPLSALASEDEELNRLAAQRDRSGMFTQVLTFDHLLTQTSFVDDMRLMLQTLHQAYDYPVDLEFTANYFQAGQYKINLLQCRPFQVVIERNQELLVDGIPRENMVLESCGAVIGQSRFVNIDRVIYVVPHFYDKLTQSDRYSLARLIGRLVHLDESMPSRSIMLLGPGRWGTSTPSLGVPASFNEIDRVSILCEIVTMREDLVPDVSLGTHFFSDLVELNILYLALFPGRKENAWNREFFEKSPNSLEHLIKDTQKWSEVLRVIDVFSIYNEKFQLKLFADAVEQKVFCFLHECQVQATLGNDPGIEVLSTSRPEKSE